MEISAAREAARLLIAPYVLRGDTIKSLRDGMGGSGRPGGMMVSISGYIDEKHYSTEWIVVRRDIYGKEVNKVFKLQEIYDELKQGQQALL